MKGSFNLIIQSGLRGIFLLNCVARAKSGRPFGLKSPGK